ncbi:calcium-binding protein, partial [Methylobacterium oryzisoli]
AGHVLAGGAGNDVYLVGNQDVRISEVAGEGDDEVRTALTSYSLLGNPAVERLTYTGADAARLDGNDDDNVITGGGGNDLLNGNAGDDRLEGGAGNDTLIGGTGADQFFGGDGLDTVSYADRTAGMTLYLQGMQAFGGEGDTFDGIETVLGTNYGDAFISGSHADTIDGSGGVDMASYALSSSAININLQSRMNMADAAGDEFKNIEVIQGTSFNDTFTGGSSNEIFIGGGGADQFDGGTGFDSVWYTTSTTGVTVDLATGVAGGADAAGDTFTAIDRLIGSNQGDTLTAPAQGMWLEGGGGNDTIVGGAGADNIFGGLAPSTDLGAAGTVPTGPQADAIHGGGGNDYLYGASDDAGSQIFGDDGDDTIHVQSATAHGGSGKDVLVGRSGGYTLYGDGGRDEINLNWDGDADGGDDGDTYYVRSLVGGRINDTGAAGTDIVVMANATNKSYISFSRKGDNLEVVAVSDPSHGIIGSTSVEIVNWYAGNRSIEGVVAADGSIAQFPT